MPDVGIAPESARDAGTFLARLIRLDPAALVRLRPAPGGVGRVELWATLPFDVLVTRTVAGTVANDITVRGDALLSVVESGPLPPRRDADWRGGLPPAPGPTLESVPAEALRGVADAAARTLRDSAGRGVGERVLRDAILDHVAVTLALDDPPREVPVPTRVVAGLARMGFLGADPVRFGLVGTWLAAHATFGSAWYRTSTGLRLDVRPGG